MLAMKAFIRGGRSPVPETENGLARTCPVMVLDEAAQLDGTWPPRLAVK